MVDLQQSDEELMREVSLSKRAALSILIRRYANSLLTFLVRMTSNHHQSEVSWLEVEQTLEGLPPQQRAVVVMRIWSDFSFKQIAEQPSTSAGSSRMS